MSGAIDPRITRGEWTPQDIITWSLMYLIQGPYGGARFYKELTKQGGFSSAGDGGEVPYAQQPIAISEFPYDLWYRLPLDWAQRIGNVKKRFVHDEGSHFAAWQTPELLAADMWEWFGDREASGTKVFL